MGPLGLVRNFAARSVDDSMVVVHLISPLLSAIKDTRQKNLKTSMHQGLKAEEIIVHKVLMPASRKRWQTVNARLVQRRHTA